MAPNAIVLFHAHVRLLVGVETLHAPICRVQNGLKPRIPAVNVAVILLAQSLRRFFPPRGKRCECVLDNVLRGCKDPFATKRPSNIPKREDPRVLWLLPPLISHRKRSCPIFESTGCRNRHLTDYQPTEPLSEPLCKICLSAKTNLLRAFLESHQ